ncbi:hypothetical protein [Burkholderia thailandensis]|uniref:hypothetical protein n=1 Tax=Burkholderia thailandensis TaxID=57975 RepID=UPI00217E9F6D|nr:hypothetical protein [Burkholderia thailandensis]MCS6489980.1 hypothetical protein [Burkholderia thailandensis]
MPIESGAREADERRSARRALERHACAIDASRLKCAARFEPAIIARARRSMRCGTRAPAFRPGTASAHWRVTAIVMRHASRRADGSHSCGNDAGSSQRTCFCAR